MVFNETFYGYSLAGHDDAHGFVRYLALVIGSRLAVWLALVTSGKFGFEREVIEKATLDRVPIPDFDALAPSQRTEVVQLFERLREGQVSWEDVDAWVARLYGLGARDLQVIVDTLTFNLPFAQNKHQAQQLPTPRDTARFCSVLAEELAPWCQRFGIQLTVALMPQLGPVNTSEAHQRPGRS
ncbi:hypothetical protein XthCFBP4691_16770 [Xanthomonas theicola]|uniref:Uncharacterized protein n=1 Tax=Xanthomonas theicola TaxID=56464 RepID=A0A2S6ZBM5_9XANT|nr:hypothetical protein XthCFBP4691_16770 [Xanthomonas theicola]